MTPDQRFVLWWLSLNLRERMLEGAPLSLEEMGQVAALLDHTRDEFETTKHLEMNRVDRRAKAAA